MENNYKRIEANILQFRLEATRDAQKMSRLAFLVSTILSLAIILATWNAYFSWYTGFARNEKMPGNKVTEHVQKEVIEQWVESANISLPFLGIKIGVGDCSVFGSFGLLLIATWFFLSIRREYDVIHSLLKNTRKPVKWDAESRRWIYYGIASYMLFINIKRIAKPGEDKKRRPKRWRPKSMMQFAFKVLVFLPPISIFLLIFADILTIFVLPANYRFPHTPLIQQNLGSGDIVKLILMESAACIFLGLIINLCTKILAYVESTAKELDEYAIDYRNELKRKV